MVQRRTWRCILPIQQQGRHFPQHGPQWQPRHAQPGTSPKRCSQGLRKRSLRHRIMRHGIDGALNILVRHRKPHQALRVGQMNPWRRLPPVTQHGAQAQPGAQCLHRIRAPAPRQTACAPPARPGLRRAGPHAQWRRTSRTGTRPGGAGRFRPRAPSTRWAMRRRSPRPTR